MEKVYKSRVYRVIFNFLCGAILSIFVFFIAHIWLSQLTSIIIATIIFFSYIWLVICGNFITIIVNDKELIVKNGKKKISMNLVNIIFVQELFLPVVTQNVVYMLLMRMETKFI